MGKGAFPIQRMWVSDSFQDPSSFYFSKSSERTVQQKKNSKRNSELTESSRGEDWILFFSLWGGNWIYTVCTVKGQSVFLERGAGKAFQVFAVLLTVLRKEVHGRKGNVFCRLFENGDSGVYIIFIFLFTRVSCYFFSLLFHFSGEGNKCNGISISILWSKMIKLWWML